jgi:hypothetical protein
VLALLALPGIQAYFTNHTEEESVCGGVSGGVLRGDGGRDELQELSMSMPQLRLMFSLLLFFSERRKVSQKTSLNI